MSEEISVIEEFESDAGDNKKGPRRKGPPAPKKKAPTQGGELEERVVAVNRVAKVVKGGRRFSFSALMIVGDKKGKVGYGLGKAKEVPEAIRKATQEAYKNMITVPLENGTIPHEILGEFDAGKILFKPACRSILELAGVHNILTKSLRGNNPHNVVKATFKALRELRSVEQIAQSREKSVKGLRVKN